MVADAAERHALVVAALGRRLGARHAILAADAAPHARPATSVRVRVRVRDRVRIRDRVRVRLRLRLRRRSHWPAAEVIARARLLAAD